MCVCVGMYAHAYVCTYVHTHASVNNPEHKPEDKDHLHHVYINNAKNCIKPSIYDTSVTYPKNAVLKYRQMVFCNHRHFQFSNEIILTSF